MPTKPVNTLFSLEQTDGFDMMALAELVCCYKTCEVVACGKKDLKIASLGSWITGYIYNAAGRCRDYGIKSRPLHT